MNISIQAIVKPNADDYNVIAESKGGDKNHVVVVDAHLDAIYGAGMLDNASGSATILDIAQKMKNVNPMNKLRFIWFGGEELGLLGSTYYVNNLTSTERVTSATTSTPTSRPHRTTSIGVLDPAAPDFFGGTVYEHVPQPGVQGIDGLAGSIDRSTSTPSGSTTSCSRRSGLTRSASTPSEFRPAVC